MSPVSSSTSSPLITLFPTGSSTTPATSNSSSSSSSGADNGQIQNTLSAIDEVQQIPDQLKQQAYNWAAQELTHLLGVLKVVLQADPQSGQTLKDLAKGISDDAKDITGQGPGSNLANPFASLVASGQSNGQSVSGTEIDISVSYSQSITQAVAQSSDNNSSSDVYFQSESDDLDVEVEVNSVDGSVDTSPETYSQDVTLLSQASVAVGQIKAILQKAIQGPHSNQNAQDANQAGNDITSSINGLINDAVSALLASPTGSLTGNIPGSFSLSA